MHHTVKDTSLTLQVKETKEYTINLSTDLTSLPMIAIDGTVSNHGTGPNTATSIGFVQSKINVAATIS